MVNEDAELDQMFVKIDKSNPYCGKCSCEMKSINLKEFKCPRCGSTYREK